MSKVLEKGREVNVNEMSSTNGALSQKLRLAVAGTIFMLPECRIVHGQMEIGFFKNS